ncbi:DUF420 domain-containing protein [Arcobacter sp. YIC-464]|uniref:DUF420 domain-containing protein n=1 Tax=Arcobacter sp. YIC-464 TaxID=3376631 RepID=UPI003C20DF2D
MFTAQGFLGTKALLFMDVVTIYFGLLPFLLAYSIKLAINQKYKLHFLWQTIILAITLVMVLIFEIGVRFTGGFIEYAKDSTLSYDFLILFLLVHIVIAIFAVAGWLYLYISSYKLYKKSGFKEFSTSKHKKIGKAIFASLTLTSIMGISIYIFLFV